MCSDNCTWEERVEGAETLAYLTEVDIDLQMLAASSDQIIELLSDYFRYPGSPLVTSLMPTKKVGCTVVPSTYMCPAVLVGNAFFYASAKMHVSRVPQRTKMFSHV